MSSFGQKDVRGFDVSVDDTCKVSSIESVCNLNSRGQNLIDRQRLAIDAVLQRHPVQKLHSNEKLVAVLTNLINRADVGMVKGRGARASRRKRSNAWGVLSHFVGQKLPEFGADDEQPITRAESERQQRG